MKLALESMQATRKTNVMTKSNTIKNSRMEQTTEREWEKMLERRKKHERHLQSLNEI